MNEKFALEPIQPVGFNGDQERSAQVRQEMGMAGLIEFECLNCGRQMAVPESAVGQQVTCTTCQTIITVPDVSMKLSGPRDVEIVHSAAYSSLGPMSAERDVVRRENRIRHSLKFKGRPRLPDFRCMSTVQTPTIRK